MATDPLRDGPVMVVEIDERAVPRMTSSQFRVSYVGLEAPVAVTVNGYVVAYYIPVRPAPRPAQQVEQSGDGSPSRDAGRTEAPEPVADAGASTTHALSGSKARRAPASGRGASRPRTPKQSAATIDDLVPADVVPTMTQAERDRVLRRVNRSGQER